MKLTDISVFEDGETYERARIPGIVCTDKGTLVAYCELRKSDSDWAVIDIGMRKSTDMGKSWSDRKILVSGENENTVNNPVMIADEGTLHFLYCINYKRVFYMKSTDEGDSWTEARELTRSIREQTGDFFWSCIATGPTHGIKLSSGRLMVPVWFAYNKEDEKSHHPSVISVLYSDNGGDSFSVGGLFDGLSDPSEFAVAEICGRVIANIRHENPERLRAVGKVSEKGEIYDVKFSDELSDPVCCGGMCLWGDELLFSNCAHERYRKNLTLRRLSSEIEVIESMLISEEAGYSDVCVSPAGDMAFVLFEQEKRLLFAAADMKL